MIGFKEETLHFDVVIVGGGMTGLEQVKTGKRRRIIVSGRIVLSCLGLRLAWGCSGTSATCFCNAVLGFIAVMF